MLRAIRRATAPSWRTVQPSRGTSQASQTRSIGPWFEGSPPARSTPAERSLARRSLSFVRVALALAMTCAAFGMPRCTAFGPSPRRNFSQISTRCRTSCSAQRRLRPFNSTLPGRAASFQLESPWPRCWNDSGIRRHSFWSFVAAAVGGRATATTLPTWYRTLRKSNWNPPVRSVRSRPFLPPTPATMPDRFPGEVVARLDLEHGAEAVAAERLPGCLAGGDKTSSAATSAWRRLSMATAISRVARTR
jgi:hypothetical protein